MSTSPETDELIQTEAAMGGSFYIPKADELRQHLQLELEERAARDQIAEATGIADADLLAELAGLGIRVESLAALTLMPLIAVAWSDGEMDERERAALLDAAVESGIERASTSYRLLEIWTLEPPPPDFSNLWRDFIHALCRLLEPSEAERLEATLLGRAKNVAEAAGDALRRNSHISSREQGCLDVLAKAFE